MFLNTDAAAMKDVKVIDDFLISANTDTESEDENEEEDALNTSCHGNHFKRMFDEDEDACDANTIKRRKLKTQLQLLHTSFSTISVTSCDKDSSKWSVAVGHMSHKDTDKIHRRKQHHLTGYFAMEVAKSVEKKSKQGWI